MKNRLQIVLVACATLAATASANAAPKCAERQTAQVRSLCQNKTMRVLIIRELMNTKAGRQEMTETLGRDGGEFRSYYETHTVNPG